MRKVTVAAIQYAIPETREKSIEQAENLVREAVAKGANVILLPELFETRISAKNADMNIIRLHFQQMKILP